MQAAVRGVAPATQTCALDGTVLDPFDRVYAHYDEEGNLTGVAFVRGKRKIVHRCGVKFRITKI